MDPQKTVTLSRPDCVIIVCGNNVGMCWLERYDRPTHKPTIDREVLGNPTHTSGFVSTESEIHDWVMKTFYGGQRGLLDDYNFNVVNELVADILEAIKALERVHVVVT